VVGVGAGACSVLAAIDRVLRVPKVQWKTDNKKGY
jgi:hypothetical protein